MQPVIVRVAATVDIDAPPAAVFALVCDPVAKATLNPYTQVIRIEREDPGPLREGSVTFFRLQKGPRIFEYRMRCLRCEPSRLIESKAELPNLFVVRTEIEPTSGGSLLRQSEECEVSPQMLEGLPVTRRAEHAWKLMKTLYLILPELAHETYALIFRERADSLRVSMQRELQGWLLAIKAHLESQPSATSPAPPPPPLSVRPVGQVRFPGRGAPRADGRMRAELPCRSGSR